MRDWIGSDFNVREGDLSVYLLIYRCFFSAPTR